MTEQHPPASILRRLSAMLYESLLLLAVSFPPLLLSAIIATLSGQVNLLVSLIAPFGLIFFWGLYFCYAWQKAGQTLPMKVWRLRLENQQGVLLSRRQIGLRFFWALLFLALIPALVYYLSRLSALPPLLSFGLAILWWLLPWGYSHFDSDKQFLYDRLVGSRIVLLPKNKK